MVETEENVEIKYTDVKKVINIREQIVFISLDDSGKLNSKEKYLVYAGLVFINKKELNHFKALYKSIRNDVAKKAYIKKLMNSKDIHLKVRTDLDY